MKLVFDTQGNEKQKEVARAWIDPTVTDIVYGGSKGSGKSFLGCSLIFGTALMYPGTHLFVARESLTDLRKFTMPSIAEVLTLWKVPPALWTYNGQDNVYNLRNGSKVFLLAASYLPSDPMFMRFGSMQMTQGWIEEAGTFHRDAKNNLQASIGRWKNKEYNLSPKLLQTCNPSKNYLYSDYYRPYKDGRLDSWKRFIQAFPEDNKMLPDGYLENLRRSLTQNQKERLLYGNWEFDDDPTALCEYDAILDVFTNKQVHPTNERRMSADLAMQGRDRFVVGVAEGNVITIVLDQSKSTGKSIEQDLQNCMIQHNIPRSKTVADSDGLGNYLSSYLNGIKEFHGGGSAIDKEYANIKSECAYKLAEKINKREIYIKCSPEQQELIAEELGVLKCVSVDKDEQKKRIISKETMKELIGRSPDFLDMLIMMQYFDVQPQPRNVVYRENNW
jgi:phage terminase large subunit